MTLARWPNEGFRGIEATEGVERVKVDTDRLARWTEEDRPLGICLLASRLG